MLVDNPRIAIGNLYEPSIKPDNKLKAIATSKTETVLTSHISVCYRHETIDI